jgi:hypothetical protein
LPSPRKVLHETSLGRLTEVVFQSAQLDEAVIEGDLVVEPVFEDQLSESEADEEVMTGLSSQGQT